MAYLKDLTEKAQRGIRVLDIPVFNTLPWVTGRPLSQRKITLISSAGLHLRSDRRFIGMDSTCREIPNDTDPGEILMGHVSTNFDRTAFIQDINTILPINLMQALVADGTIGAVSDTHYSFMGGADPRDMETHARALARKLLAEGVDAALLLPTCPHCTRAVSVIAHYLEDEGIATTVVGLIRELLERASPPRALWVPFEMGRPLGPPAAPDVQIAVLRAALSLLDRPDEPGLLENYPSEDLIEQWNWGPPLETQRTNIPTGKGLEFGAALAAELDLISPLRSAGVARLGRSSFGLSGLDINTIRDLLLSYLGETRLENPNTAFSELLTMRFALDDIKTYYFEAALAIANCAASKPLVDWFWTRTVAGQLLIELRDKGLQDPDPKLNLISANFTIPHKYVVDLNLRPV